MKGDPAISRVYRLGEAASVEDATVAFARMENLRRKAWRKHGLVVVQPSELPEALGAELKSWVEETYGRR